MIAIPTANKYANYVSRYILVQRMAVISCSNRGVEGSQKTFTKYSTNAFSPSKKKSPSRGDKLSFRSIVSASISFDRHNSEIRPSSIHRITIFVVYVFALEGCFTVLPNSSSSGFISLSSTFFLCR